MIGNEDEIHEEGEVALSLDKWMVIQMVKWRNYPSLNFGEKGSTIVCKSWTRFRLWVEDMIGNEDEIHEEGENEKTKEDAPYLID